MLFCRTGGTRGRTKAVELQHILYFRYAKVMHFVCDCRVANTVGGGPLMISEELWVVFDALLMAAIEDKTDEQLKKFIDFLNSSNFSNSLSPNELKFEEGNIKYIIQLCRKVAMDLERYQNNEEELTDDREKFLQKTRLAIQGRSAYGWDAGLFFERYLAAKLSHENEDSLFSAQFRHVPITDREANIDNPAAQKKRRNENNHTLKVRLKELWGIEVGTRTEEYNVFCDLLDSILVNLKKPKKKSAEQRREDKEEEDGKKEKLERTSSRIRLLELFKNRDILPFDIFKRTGESCILDNTSRYIMREFIRKLMGLVELEDLYLYARLKEFWEKWHSDFIDAIYDFALSEQPPEKLYSFYYRRWGLEAQDGIEKAAFCGSLFSEVLFHLLKEEMKLKLYQVQYIVKHSRIKMEALNEEQIKVRHLFMDPKVAICEVSYDEVEQVIRQYHKEVQSFLGYDADVSETFSQAKQLMEIIVAPSKKTVLFWEFITIMQCCTSSRDSELEITRYRMKRGKIKVKLSEIIEDVDYYRCEETRLFLLHLMRRRYFMNRFEQDIVDQIDGYRLALEEGVSNSLDNMGSWDTIRPTLSGIKDAYDEAVAQYAGELGMI